MSQEEQPQIQLNPPNDPLALPRNEPTIQTILQDPTTTSTSKIDALAQARGWCRPDPENHFILTAYLAGTLSAIETAEILATPIEETYTSADAGALFWETESTARACRPLCSAEEVEEFWGEPVSMCEPDPALRWQGGSTTEGGLGRLWLGLVHASRETEWSGDDDGEGQMMKLVRFVQTLKGRPDPPLPAGATPALLNNWLYQTGGLWSDLTLLGPNVRESWNDAPGGTMGFSELEVKAWERENAFVALLTVTGTADFLNYGVWAMRDALEGGIAQMRQLRCTPEFKAELLEVTLGVVGVWLSIAGEEFYYRRSVETVEDVAVVDSGVLSAWRSSSEVSDARWRFWKRRLAKFAQDGKVSALSRSHAVRAVEEMRRIEEAHDELQ